MIENFYPDKRARGDALFEISEKAREVSNLSLNALDSIHDQALMIQARDEIKFQLDILDDYFEEFKDLV